METQIKIIDKKNKNFHAEFVAIFRYGSLFSLTEENILGILTDMFKEGTKAVASAAKVSAEAANAVAEDLFERVKTTGEITKEIADSVSSSEKEGYWPKDD